MKPARPTAHLAARPAARLAALLIVVAAFLAVLSCAANQQPPSSFAGLEKAQVPSWSADDMQSFLHGSMSTEFVPESVLRAFIVTYPDLFPKSDLSNLGLIPDPSFGWPIGFSRGRPAHLAGLMSVGINGAAFHVGTVDSPSGQGSLRVLGATAPFDAEAFYATVIAATWRTQDPANMKKFLAEYLRQSDQDPDPAHRAAHDELFNSSWKSQEKEIAAAIAADPAGSQGASLGNLQALPNAALHLNPETLAHAQNLSALSVSMLKLFHNMRAALHIPDQAPSSPPPLAGGPGRNDAFGLLSAELFHEPHPYAPSKYGILFNLSDRPWIDWDGNTRSPLARNILAAVGLGAPLIGNHADLYFSLIERQTNISEQIAPPKYPFAIDTKAARRGALYYQVSCMGCHEGEQNDTRLYTLTELGTDPLRAQLFTQHTADQFNNFMNTVEIAGYTPTNPPPFRSTQKYWAPSLAGVWARSPYLHNGSIRSLTDLLTPPVDRPKSFHRGSTLFDPANVGFTDTGSFLLNTQTPGNSAAGHDYGTAFTPDQKHDLIEYLKSL